MKEQINDLLLKMQNGENCIGETANQLLDLFAVSSSLPSVDVSSNQFFINGLFHRYIDIKGITYALVEINNGSLEKYDLSVYSLRFIRQ